MIFFPIEDSLTTLVAYSNTNTPTVKLYTTNGKMLIILISVISAFIVAIATVGICICCCCILKIKKSKCHFLVNSYSLISSFVEHVQENSTDFSLPRHLQPNPIYESTTDGGLYDIIVDTKNLTSLYIKDNSDNTSPHYDKLYFPFKTKESDLFSEKSRYS